MVRKKWRVYHHRYYTPSCVNRDFLASQLEFFEVSEYSFVEGTSTEKLKEGTCKKRLGDDNIKGWQKWKYFNYCTACCSCCFRYVEEVRFYAFSMRSLENSIIHHSKSGSLALGGISFPLPPFSSLSAFTMGSISADL